MVTGRYFRWSIHEVPSHERPRINGTSNLRTIKDGWRILRVILLEKFGSGRGKLMPGYPAAAGIGILEPMRIAGADAKTDPELESL